MKTLPILDWWQSKSLLRNVKKSLPVKLRKCEAVQVSAAFKLLAKQAELNHEQFFLLEPFVAYAIQRAFAAGLRANRP